MTDHTGWSATAVDDATKPRKSHRLTTMSGTVAFADLSKAKVGRV
jgi:hypothetical protein